jgi:hypothetical protein
MDWPDELISGSIRAWPGDLTPQSRRRSPTFKASLTQTVKTLSTEIRNLCDTRAQRESAELLLAIPAEGFRLDGKPRANAYPEHPGVIFSIDSKHGRLSYPCDTFTTWQANLRAIALALEALRLVDRYGVTRRGEQYRGFLELEATAAPAGFRTSLEAIEFLAQVAGGVEDGPVPNLVVLRRAQRAGHPDNGGDPALFQRVSLAEAKLRQENLL